MAGTENESGQTLTVTAADPTTGSTHSSASLLASPDTYSPDANYNGAASFHYTVQDNGTSNGLNDFKSDTGTVSVTITEVNDAPTAVNDAKTVDGKSAV